MDAIATITAREMSAVQPITTELFTDFVRYLDRCERTTRAYLTNARQFFAWLRREQITRPERQDIISYRDWLMVEHDAICFTPETATGWSYRTDRSGHTVRITCKAATVKAYLQSVKQFFSWTASSGIYPNVAANVHAPKIAEGHKRDSFTAAQVQKIEDSIAAASTARIDAAAQALKDQAGRIQRSTEQGKRLYAMYLLAVNAGLRTVEISRAAVKDLKTTDGKTYLYVWGKGSSEADQKKPIVPEVKAAIDDYLASRTDRYTSNSPLFVSTGNRSGGQRIAPTTIGTMLKAAMRDAGYDSDRLTAHSLRHTAAQNVLEVTGQNIYQTQQYMRHSNPKTTEIYLTNDSTEDDERIAAQLYGHYHGKQNDPKTKLETLLTGMSQKQLEQLAAIAEAMH